MALTRTKKKVFVYGEENAYFINEITNDENIKKDYHYNILDIPIVKEPNRIIVINYVKGNMKEKREETPAKNIGIEPGDLIIKVEDKINSSKKDLDIALKNSEGKEIKIQIKKKNNEILERLIKPFDKNNGINNKKTWSIGANYFDREIDPFVESLINKYNVFDKNIKEILKSNV